MDYIAFLPLYLVINISSFTFNGSTMIYIVRSFDISTHVFFIVFIDALISTLCAFFSLMADAMAILGLMSTNEFYCTAVFISTFLPHNFGTFLTMIVALIRYTLAKKSAMNIHYSNFRVLFVSLMGFFLLAILTISHLFLNILLDIPQSFVSESCSAQFREARPVPLFNVLVLMSPTLYSILSLITDVFMMRFLRKTIQIRTKVHPHRHLQVWTTELNAGVEMQGETSLNKYIMYLA